MISSLIQLGLNQRSSLPVLLLYRWPCTSVRVMLSSQHSLSVTPYGGLLQPAAFAAAAAAVTAAAW